MAAFAVDPYQACEQFVNWQLQKGKNPDVSLAELRRLSLFGGMSDQAMSFAFVHRLPEDTSASS